MSAPHQTQRLGGDEFEGTEELNQERLQRLVIDGRSSIHAKLVTEDEITEVGFNPYVVTTFRLNAEGEFLESYFDIGQERSTRKHKFPAKRIFKNVASPDTKVIVGNINFGLFNFPPSSNHSDWLNASDFGLEFQKKNSKSEGTYSTAEWTEQGVGDFALKVVIQATSQVGVAAARIVALPLPVEKLGELPGGDAKTNHFYPCIDVFANPTELLSLPQNTDPVRGDALPVLPLFLYQGPPDSELGVINAAKTFQAMYSVWSGLHGVRGCTADLFHRLTTATPIDVAPVPPEWAWPLLQLQAEEEDEQNAASGESDCDEDDDAEYESRMAARTSFATAAEIARLAALANSGRTPPSSNLARTPPSRMSSGTTTTSTATTTTTTMVSTSSMMTTTSAGYRIPRMSSKRATSSGTEEAAGSSKKARLSELLLKKDWPTGYTSEMIDKIDDINAINAIKDRELKLKKTEKRNRPGVRPGMDLDEEIPTTELSAAKDNSKDLLCDARFLPPVVADISEYFDRVLVKLPVEVASWAEKRLGTANMIPPNTFLDRHDRTLALKAKHYLEANFHVDKATDKTTARVNKGVLEVGEKDPDYLEPKTVHDLITCLLNMMAVDFQLWPGDATAMTLLRVALEYDFFALARNEKHRVEVFTLFINQVLSHNARYFRQPPLDYDGIKNVAVVLCRSNHMSTLPVAETRYLQQFAGINTGGNNNADGDGHAGGRGRGRGDRGRGGRGGRGGGRPEGGRQDKGRLPRDNNKLFYKGSPICRDFNYERCERVKSGDGCKTPYGTVLQHLCGTVKAVGADGSVSLCGGKHDHNHCPSRSG